MRLTIAAAVLSVPIFMVALSPKAHAQPQDNQQPKNTSTNQNVVEVKTGDSLTSIASQHQTTYPRLFDANPKIIHPDLIYPGDKVRIPDPNEQLASRTIATAAKPSAAPSQKLNQKTTSTPKKMNYSTPSGAGVWASLAQCEAGGNWAANTGNGYYGGLQFTLSTWRSVGGSGYPNEASSSEQIARAQMLQSRQGWGAWPACSAKLGL